MSTTMPETAGSPVIGTGSANVFPPSTELAERLTRETAALESTAVYELAIRAEAVRLAEYAERTGCPVDLLREALAGGGSQ